MNTDGLSGPRIGSRTLISEGNSAASNDVAKAPALKLGSRAISNGSDFDTYEPSASEVSQTLYTSEGRLIGLSETGAIIPAETAPTGTRNETAAATTSAGAGASTDATGVGEPSPPGRTPLPTPPLPGTPITSSTTAAQIAALGSGVANLTVTDLQELSQSAVGGFTASEITYLTAAQIDALSEQAYSEGKPIFAPAKLASLTDAAIGALSSTQIASLNDLQLASFSASQVASLSTSAVSSLTAAQVFLLGANVSQLSSAQLMSLTAAAIAGLRAPAIAAFSNAQLAELTNNGASLSLLSSDNTAYPDGAPLYEFGGLYGLTSSQIASLSPASLASLSAEQIGALSPSGVSGLTAAQIAAIGANVSGLTSSQISSLTNSALVSFSTGQIADLTPSAVSGLTEAQIQALSASQIASLTVSQIGALTATQLGALTTTQLSSFSASQQSAITDLQYAAFSSAQRAALSVTNYDDTFASLPDFIALGENASGAQTSQNTGGAVTVSVTNSTLSGSASYSNAGVLESESLTYANGNTLTYSKANGYIEVDETYSSGLQSSQVNTASGVYATTIEEGAAPYEYQSGGSTETATAEVFDSSFSTASGPVTISQDYVSSQSISAVNQGLEALNPTAPAGPSPAPTTPAPTILPTQAPITISAPANIWGPAGQPGGSDPYGIIATFTVLAGGVGGWLGALLGFGGTVASVTNSDGSTDITGWEIPTGEYDGGTSPGWVFVPDGQVQVTLDNGQQETVIGSQTTNGNGSITITETVIAN